VIITFPKNTLHHGLYYYYYYYYYYYWGCVTLKFVHADSLSCDTSISENL